MKDIATISRTREIMEQYGLSAKKKYGQNFLTEPSIVRRMAASVPLRHPGVIIEIGPGIGALTEQLARVAQQVVAYEIDERLPDVLRQTLADYPNVTIVQQDFLKTDVAALTQSYRAQGYDVAVAANLPYYITTPLLFHLFEADAGISSITVMMQKEVADRFTAQPYGKDYNALTVITRYMCEAKTIIRVPKEVFVPKPNVDSAVVQFLLRPYVRQVNDQTAFFRMVKGCFAQRRKTILNNFSSYLNDKELAKTYLTRAGIACGQRAETCTLDTFLDLYEVMEDDRTGIR